MNENWPGGCPGDLGDLCALNHLYPETMRIYGRTWMARFKKSGNLSDLEQSRNFCLEAFEKAPDNYYIGINAAAKRLLLGEVEKAKAIAKRIEDLVGDQSVPVDYYSHTATIAEIFLISQEFDKVASLCHWA